MIIRINYRRETKQQPQGGVLIKNIADSAPFIWSFVGIIIRLFGKFRALNYFIFYFLAKTFFLV